jgi:hypothetical protein
MRKELTELQAKFLEVLFDDDVKGDIRKAMNKSGYTPGADKSKLINSMRDHIVEAAETYLAMNSPKAAVALTDSMDDPTSLGIKEKLTAAKEILDRAGIVKKDGLTGIGDAAAGVIFIIPQKDNEEV